MLRQKISVLLFSLGFFLHLEAQNTTINPDKKEESLKSIDLILQSHKVLIIPFAPKMYMSEIDKQVSLETKLNAPQIYSAFREGLDEMLFFAVKPRMSVYSLLNDSAKNARDMATVYNSISYSYDLVPKENTSFEELNKPRPANNTPKIVNGQLVVEPNFEKKFMNTKINKIELLPYLIKRYKSSVFIFINELDIKNNIDSYDAATDTYQRVVTVHYSILDKNGKYMDFGIATSSFSSTVNDPNKITKSTFTEIAKIISDRLIGSLTPKEQKIAEEIKSQPKYRQN